MLRFFAYFFILVFVAKSQVIAGEARQELLPMPQVGEDGLHVQEWFHDSFLDLSEDLEYHLKREKQFELINKALKQLSKRCGQLLEMFYQKKYSMKKIAAALKFANEKSARVQKHKCMTHAKTFAHEEITKSVKA